ncbi:hypothetical protein LDENG_00257630 [Lucifuga dentata]|nr:hypothetical protein LDENG_00257630 [Lucifuga dentata]
MSQILEGLEGVVCQMDDVLVYAETQVLHDLRLRAVLQRLEKAGVTLKTEKCEFSKTSVKFLGQIIEQTGVRADPDKVRAVINMEEPTDVSGVRRFLGMVNHLDKTSYSVVGSLDDVVDWEGLGPAGAFLQRRGWIGQRGNGKVRYKVLARYQTATFRLVREWLVEAAGRVFAPPGVH